MEQREIERGNCVRRVSGAVSSGGNLNAGGSRKVAEARSLNSRPHQINTTKFPSTGTPIAKRPRPPLVVLPRPAPSTGPPLRRQLQNERTHVLGDTLDLCTLLVQEVSGTIITPENLFDALSMRKMAEGTGKGLGDVDAHYHLSVAIQAVLETRFPNYVPDTDKPDSRMVQDTLERLVVEVAAAVHERTTAPVMLFVDPKRHRDTMGIVRSAKRMISLMVGPKAVPKHHIILSVVATEDGVKAAQKLEADGLYTNLLLVSSLRHACVCIEARAAIISISVASLLEAHEQRLARTFPDLLTHPGIQEILAINHYFKRHNLRARFFGMDFRRLPEVAALPGLQAVALTSNQLQNVGTTKVPQRPGSLEASRKVHETAAARAANTEFPPTILEKNPDGFMRGLSKAARAEIRETMGPELARMQEFARRVEDVIREELARVLAVRKAPVEELPVWGVVFPDMSSQSQA
ncbi:BZIP domain-containing protein [Mycena chlorophos]|uniref:BZIP domain-containing protein n=1 Tax=Mycena chlorophos TaxID=658473 RepID=A0A8H6WJ77_MYCCL|nr:BZIP domain-containing protein [Mycena chlorophos]